MKTSSNNNNIESKNGMSQVINILTGETKKIRCHYISSRTDKPVSRVLTLERLSHPALTAAGVTAWAERFNDGVNSFDWLRVSIQLTDKICYTPNCANVGLPDVENYGNLDYYMGQEGAMRVSMNNVDKFFQSIADKPAKMMTGEDWPNMAVIAAYRAAGRDEEADTLTTARDTYNARREAKNEAWSKKYAAQQYYYNSPKPKNFSDLTELEKAQYLMEVAQECAKEHPELDWTDVLEKAEKRLEKAKEWQEFLDREAEKQNSFAEGMRVKVPAASLERNRDKEAFVITRIRRKAADNGGNASLTVKSELTGIEKDINGSDVSEILPALQEASGIKVGTEVWTTIELHEEYGKLGKVVRRFFADHGVWCLDIEFEDGTTATYAEEYVTTEKPWAVVGAKCRHKYLNRDVVLTITAVGQYYGIKAESEDGKVKRCGLVRDFEPVEDGKAEKAASGIKDDSFFIKGKKYRCIKSVVMKKGGKTAFKAGSIYEQVCEPTHWVGWLRNEQGERHAWPQPVYIADEVKTWGTKPEDIDPRLYFEPVEDTTETEEITEAEGIKVGDKVRHNKHEEVATVTAIREAFVNGCDGYRYLYTLDFGQSVKGPFDVELNGGEFLREAFTVCEA